MLNTSHETLLPLTEAARLVRKDLSTLYRWTRRGFRGVVLETIQVGGTRNTTREALQRFFERLTVREHIPAPSRPRSEKHATEAGEELDCYGI